MVDLADRLRSRILEDGPLTFRDWMEACLYDPDDGYYMRSGPPRTGADPGDGSDFATSPTLHPFMARAVAEEAEGVWQACGRPDRFTIIEFGGGAGDLARDALQWMDDQTPALGAAVAWLHIETSPAHREAQAGGDPRIHQSDSMPKHTTGLVIAHEFVDALPFHWLERRKGGWAEVRVALNGDDFTGTLGIPTRSAIEAAPKRLLEEGQRVVSMVEARRWIDKVAGRLERGGVLIVDYGDLGKALWTPERRDGTVRGYRDHRLVPDVLADPGQVDITASVDFTQLRMWGLDAGMQDGGLESQESFLVRHGILEVLAEASRDTLEDASAYLRLKQLMLPQAMGSVFKVQRLWKDIDMTDAEEGDAEDEG